MKGEFSTIYEWNSNLEIGYPIIDAQHKGLFDTMNRFFSSCYYPYEMKREDVEEALLYLEQYTKEHFETEETIQIESSYPEYNQHKRFHEEFKIMVRGLKSDLERKGPTRELLGQIEMAIASWLVDHIEIEDMKIGRHLHRINEIREGLARRSGVVAGDIAISTRNDDEEAGDAEIPIHI
ncbi:MAG: hemerythrin family protein [Synergistaceae bacterium]|nr:hemerythrin family protein [Synergistaceae bacterium]